MQLTLKSFNVASAVIFPPFCGVNYRSALAGQPFYWAILPGTELRSVRTCTKLHRLTGSNIRFIGPVNSEPRVHTSKMSKRIDLSLAEKIALLDNESQLSSTGPLFVQ